MLEKVGIFKSDGTKLSLDLISLFKINADNNEKEFALLTANEIDQNGLIKILASQIVDGKVEKIQDDNDWILVKNVMRAIISSSQGEFTYVTPNTSLSFSASDDFSRVIAVQESAKTALINDYNEKRPPKEEIKKEEVKVDPNAAIYPTEEAANDGKEVTPGISEEVEEPKLDEASPSTPSVEDVNPVLNLDINTDEATFESAEQPVENTPTESEVTQPVEETPNSDIADLNQIMNPAPTIEENTSSNTNDAREELIKDITKAVDKYLSSTQSNTNNNQTDVSSLKETIAKMEEQLKTMSEVLNTQE